MRVRSKWPQNHLFMRRFKWMAGVLRSVAIQAQGIVAERDPGNKGATGLLAEPEPRPCRLKKRFHHMEAEKRKHERKRKSSVVSQRLACSLQTFLRTDISEMRRGHCTCVGNTPLGCAVAGIEQVGEGRERWRYSVV